MILVNKNAEIFVPDNKPINQAISRTTHMAIAAHPDDLEIMAYDGILKCYNNKNKWFCGVVVTNGSGSPRGGTYSNYSNEKICEIRKTEQKKAAVIGKYGSVILLDYASSEVKNSKNKNPEKDMLELLKLTKPEVVYIHNLADKHDTHIAVALRTIQAIRELPDNLKPKYVYGCEVWRDLDWLSDEDKIIFDVSANEKLAKRLLSVFHSQTCGGKRYDLATIARRKTNATFISFNKIDNATSFIYAMDLTPLIKNKHLNIKKYMLKYINKFSLEVSGKIEKII
ncbi:MAG: GlcNAc-PI de-N-acetylase [Elusimicrobia bacterium RIFOXYD2_FULL_34_15]|nr:MAG: GlcNAc-PI de-N-acetylase [Elusimicrobia bacterium RIFOXYD2_FULL_34_15]